MAQVERLAQGGERLAVRDEAAQRGQRRAGNLYRQPPTNPQNVVVGQHQRAVGGGTHVGLDHISAERHGQREAAQAVLRRATGNATVGDAQKRPRPARHVAVASAYSAGGRRKRGQTRGFRSGPPPSA